MKDRLSFSDRTSFSRFSHRFKTACISEGIVGVKFLSFASAILHFKVINLETCIQYNTRYEENFLICFR
jgi:hypothetical protein